MDTLMEGLSLEERAYWSILEYTKLLNGEKSVADPFLTSDAFAVAPMEDASVVRGEERKLQLGVDWKLQEYVFEGCTFQHNEQGEPVHGDLLRFGIVTIQESYDVATFENCTFYNNSYGNPEDVVS
jgi:hypothetical protein